MKNNRLWVCPNNDLEAKTIIEMLAREGEKYLVTGQTWGASWEKLEEEIKKELKEALENGVEIPEKANEVLTDGNYNYYLYADMISFYNKTSFDYKENKTSYKSLNLKDDKASGYLEINQKNDKYLIEIMYNYAKIEVIVDKDDINKAIVNSMIVLTTIDYTDDVIKNLLSIDDMTSSEENFSLFDESNDSNLLEVIKPGDYVDKDEVPDPDVIN